MAAAELANLDTVVRADNARVRDRRQRRGASQKPSARYGIHNALPLQFYLILKLRLCATHSPARGECLAHPTAHPRGPECVDPGRTRCALRRERHAVRRHSRPRQARHGAALSTPPALEGPCEQEIGHEVSKRLLVVLRRDDIGEGDESSRQIEPVDSGLHRRRKQGRHGRGTARRQNSGLPFRSGRARNPWTMARISVTRWPASGLPRISEAQAQCSSLLCGRA